MSNQSSNNLLYFIYSFTIVMGVIFSIAMMTSIIQTIGSAKEISIPTHLEVDLIAPGYIQYEGNPKLDIEFTQIKGKVVYKEDNPTHAPIAWREFIFPFLRMALLLLIIGLTAKIMQTSLKEEPFIKANAQRLKWIAYSLLLMAVLRHLDAAVELHTLRNYLVSQYVTIDSHNTAYALGKFVGQLFASEFPMGVFVFFIATLFKHGIAIQEENALTV